MEIKLPPRTHSDDRKFYDGCGPARSLGPAKLNRTGVSTPPVTRAGPREREMLFVPEARNAEITGVIRASRLLSHISHTKWHGFPEAVLVIHRGGRERRSGRKRRDTLFRLVSQAIFAPPPHLTAFLSLFRRTADCNSCFARRIRSNITNDTQQKRIRCKRVRAAITALFVLFVRHRGFPPSPPGALLFH